jgi:hypothetical protein
MNGSSYIVLEEGEGAGRGIRAPGPADERGNHAPRPAARLCRRLRRGRRCLTNGAWRVLADGFANSDGDIHSTDCWHRLAADEWHASSGHGNSNWDRYAAVISDGDTNWNGHAADNRDFDGSRKHCGATSN